MISNLVLSRTICLEVGVHGIGEWRKVFACGRVKRVNRNRFEIRFRLGE